LTGRKVFFYNGGNRNGEGMSEQSEDPQDHPLANMLDGARYFEAAEQLLDIQLLPEEVQASLADSRPPEGISWQGAPVWRTAYFSALRTLAVTRASERRYAKEFEEYSPQQFNAKWQEAYLSGSLTSLLEVAVTQAADETTLANMRRAARNVLLANNITHPDELPSTAWADREGPRANLQHYFGSVLRWFAQSPPRATELPASGRAPLMPNTITLVAPTGIGKTMVGGDYLAAARVGEMDGQGGRHRAIWVTTSQALIRDCLNPDKTLQRCLPDHVLTTAIWEHGKDETDGDGDVVCVTMQSLEDALTKGLLTPEDFDIMVFDEAHHALTSRMIDLISKFECQKILMTATPSRSEYRSLLHNYHYVRPMGRREAVEKDLLSPVRMLTMQSDSMAHAEQLAALTAIELFIRQGKKAVIYCQPGGDNAQARRVALLVNRFARDDEDLDSDEIYAEMVGSTRADSDYSVRRFEEQTLGGVRTTCQMLGEGWDYAELDGVIFVGPQGDLVALEQESGRALRPKADGREAVLVEILTPFGQDRQGLRYCLAQTFGLENIPGANVVLGHHRPFRFANEEEGTTDNTVKPAQGGPPPYPYANPEGDGGGESEPHGTTGAGGDGGDGSSDPRPHVDPIQLPHQLREAEVAPGTSIAEIIISPERRGKYVPPREFAVTASSLAEEYGLPVGYIHYHFETRKGAQAVPYKLIRNLPTDDQTPEEMLAYDRYYHTEQLQARLAEQPLPRVSAEQVYSRAMLADMFHAPENMVEEAIVALELPSREPTRTSVDMGRRGAKPVQRYTVEEMNQISEWIERVPLAEPEDMTYARLVERYPFAARYLTLEDRTVKRHRPDTDRKGTDYFVTPDVVTRVEAEHARRNAGGLMTLNEVAELADVPVTILKRALSAEESATAKSNRFTPKGGTSHAQHLPVDMAEAVIERIKPRPLEPTEITYQVFADRINASATELRQFVRPHGSEQMRRLPGSNYQVRTYPLHLLREAEKRYGIRPEHAGRPIDYDAIPEKGGLTRVQAAAARRIQLEVLDLPPKILTNSEDATGRPAPKPAAAPEPSAETAANLGRAGLVFSSETVISSATAGSKTAKSKPETESKSAEPEDSWRWVERSSIIAALRCTPAALERLASLVADDELLRRDDEGGLLSVRTDAFQNLSAYSRSLIKVPRAPEGWRSHAALLRFTGATEQDLAEYLTKVHQPEADEWKVARLHGATVSLDVVYSPRYANLAFGYLRERASKRQQQ
jgi:hypothetical protein